MSWREYQIYRKVESIPGVPPLGPRLGSHGYYHEYIEGKTLFEVKREGIDLPETFFNDLRKIIDEIHKRDICYVDLNKLGNIIFGRDGKPYLIDYQVSLEVPKLLLVARLFRGFFEQLKREDLYHLYKHKSRFLANTMTSEELVLAKKSNFNQVIDLIAGRPWRWIKRLFYPHGSNEVIWYKWRNMPESKDSAMEMP
jgi:RIO-like serine/threonine protein kinase